MGKEPINTEAEAKALEVLTRAFRGIHHVDGWRRRKPFGDGVVVSIGSRDLSTYDFDTLTRLVIAAHDVCVRMEILAGGPYNMRLAFHDRKRQGPESRMSEGHPTIEDAIVAARTGKWGPA